MHAAMFVESSGKQHYPECFAREQSDAEIRKINDQREIDKIDVNS
jgi:hypothetical protein